MKKEVYFGYWMILGVTRASGRINKAKLPRCTVKKPALDENEIAIKLEIMVPEALFNKPQLKLKVDIPEPKEVFELSPDVQEDIAERMTEMTGMKISVTFPDEKEE